MSYSAEDIVSSDANFRSMFDPKSESYHGNQGGASASAHALRPVPLKGNKLPSGMSAADWVALPEGQEEAAPVEYGERHEALLKQREATGAAQRSAAALVAPVEGAAAAHAKLAALAADAPQRGRQEKLCASADKRLQTALGTLRGKTEALAALESHATRVASALALAADIDNPLTAAAARMMGSRAKLLAKQLGEDQKRCLAEIKALKADQRPAIPVVAAAAPRVEEAASAAAEQRRVLANPEGIEYVSAIGELREECSAFAGQREGQIFGSVSGITGYFTAGNTRCPVPCCLRHRAQLLTSLSAQALRS